jgi:hypothetical protein
MAILISTNRNLTLITKNYSPNRLITFFVTQQLSKIDCSFFLGQISDYHCNAHFTS